METAVAFEDFDGTLTGDGRLGSLDGCTAVFFEGLDGFGFCPKVSRLSIII